MGKSAAKKKKAAAPKALVKTTKPKKKPRAKSKAPLPVVEVADEEVVEIADEEVVEMPVPEPVPVPAMPMPFTPTKEQLNTPFFKTPKKDDILVLLKIGYQYIDTKGRTYALPVAIIDGRTSETAFALVGPDVILESTGCEWDTGLVSWNKKPLPAWPNPDAPLRGFSYGRLKNQDKSVPSSLHMGLREINDIYNGDMKKVAMKAQVR